MSELDKEKQLTLGVLQAIEQKEDISQRHLASELGVALGLTNSYLKRLAKKGWIKITTAPANRYLYYLTPKGFAEKSRLTAEFLSTSLTLFREAGDAYTEIFKQCEQRGWKQVALLGVSDLTEIAYLRSLEQGVEVSSVIDPFSSRREFFSKPVIDAIDRSCNAVILTALEQADDLKAHIRESNGALALLIPEFMNKIKFNMPNPESQTGARQQSGSSNSSHSMG